MSLCSMCFQQRNTSPLWVGGPPVTKVAEDVCRGCAMSIEKAFNYISFRGYTVQLVRSPKMWSDAVDDELRGDGLGSGPEINPDAESDTAVPVPESNGAVSPAQRPPKTVAGRHPPSGGAGA